MEFLISIYFIANGLLTFVLLLLLYHKKPLNFLGFLIIFTQFLTIFFVIVNRSLGPGFSLFVFFSIVFLQGLTPLVINFFGKRNKNKKTFLKTLFWRLNVFLDIAFFNIFFVNKGMFFYSRKAFTQIEFIFRQYTVRKWINLLLLYPWAIFVGVFLIEILFFQRIHLSAVLLSINLLIYRLGLLSLKIIQRHCIESLDAINKKRFFGALGEKETLPSFFIQSINITAILDTHEKLEENYLCEKWYDCYLGVAFAGSFLRVTF